MAAKIYAQLDKDNICFCVSQLAGVVISDRLIPIDSMDADVLGRRYENGEWLELPEPELEPEQEPEQQQELEQETGIEAQQ